MNIGVHTSPLYNRSFEEALAYLDELNVDAVEPGVGGYPGNEHLDRQACLNDKEVQAELAELLDEHEMQISGLAAHKNPLHPNDERASQADTESEKQLNSPHSLR